MPLKSELTGVQFGFLIMRCLAAISLPLWFVQRRAYTGNRDKLVFLFLFIYSLFRVGPLKDLNTKMIVVSSALVGVFNDSSLSAYLT